MLMPMNKPRYARPAGWRLGAHPLPRIFPTCHLDAPTPLQLGFYLKCALCDYSYGYWVEHHIRFTWLRRGLEDDFLVAIGKTWWNNE